MPIMRLNHAVLYVRDAEKSAAFYTEALGFKKVMAMPGACEPDCGVDLAVQELEGRGGLQNAGTVGCGRGAHRSRPADRDAR